MLIPLWQKELGHQQPCYLSCGVNAPPCDIVLTGDILTQWWTFDPNSPRRSYICLSWLVWCHFNIIWWSLSVEKWNRDNLDSLRVAIKRARWQVTWQYKALFETWNKANKSKAWAYFEILGHKCIKTIKKLSPISNFLLRNGQLLWHLKGVVAHGNTDDKNPIRLKFETIILIVNLGGSFCANHMMQILSDIEVAPKR